MNTVECDRARRMLGMVPSSNADATLYGTYYMVGASVAPVGPTRSRVGLMECV
jgi:hypothetical protein